MLPRYTSIWNFIFLIVRERNVQSQYVQNYKTGVTWISANSKCGKDGLEHNATILTQLPSLHHQQFWIGLGIYKILSPWMEVLGCYRLQNQSAILITSSAGLCQRECNSTKYFTYKKHLKECMCLGNDINGWSKFSLHNCTQQNLSSAALVYEVFQEYVPHGNGEHCTTLKCLGGQNNLKAVNCNTDSFVAGRCGNDELSHAIWGKTYSTIQQWCMVRNQLLLAPSYCSRHKNEGISSWTNVFRDVFECQLTKAEGGNDIPTQCLAGQLVQDNGQWNLIKTKTDCNEGLHWFLCRNDLVSTTIMSSNKTSPTSKLRERQTKTTNMNILVSLKRNIITSYITTESISYTTYMNTSKTPRVTVNRMQTKNQKDLYHNGNNATNIGAVIGGTLGVCFLIAVLSVLIVCKLRIKNIFTESNKHDYEDTSQVNFSKKVYEELNNTRNKSTTTTSTQTCDLDESNSTVYDEIN